MKLIDTIEKEYKEVNSTFVKEVKTEGEDCKLDLVPLYLSYLESREANCGPKRSAESIYRTCLQLIKKSKEDYALKDIHTFSLQYATVLSCTDPTDFGIFISALINKHFEENHTNEEYVVFTDQERSEISFLGMKNNGARIVTMGSSGPFAGSFMENGLLHIQGDTEHKVGFKMIGGKIIVEQNANQYAGSNMFNGEIVIRGNAGDNIGEHIQGGIIRIEGESIGTLSKNASKYIYHKEELLSEKREKMQKKTEKVPILQRLKKWF